MAHQTELLLARLLSHTHLTLLQHTHMQVTFPVGEREREKWRVGHEDYSQIKQYGWKEKNVCGYIYIYFLFLSLQLPKPILS